MTAFQLALTIGLFFLALTVRTALEAAGTPAGLALWRAIRAALVWTWSGLSGACRESWAAWKAERAEDRAFHALARAILNRKAARR